MLAVIVLFFGFDRVDVFLFRGADRINARRASASVKKTVAIAPMHISYTIEGDTWRSDVGGRSMSKEFRLDDVHEVVCDGSICLVFRSRNTMRFCSKVWMMTPEVCEAFERFTD